MFFQKKISHFLFSGFQGKGGGLISTIIHTLFRRNELSFIQSLLKWGQNDIAVPQAPLDPDRSSSTNFLTQRRGILISAIWSSLDFKIMSLCHRTSRISSKSDTKGKGSLNSRIFVDRPAVRRIIWMHFSVCKLLILHSHFGFPWQPIWTSNDARAKLSLNSILRLRFNEDIENWETRSWLEYNIRV